MIRKRNKETGVVSKEKIRRKKIGWHRLAAAVLVCCMLIGVSTTEVPAASISSNAAVKTAVQFQPDMSYMAGDYVIYENELCVCRQDASGAWANVSRHFLKMTKNSEIGESSELSAAYAKNSDPKSQTSIMAFLANAWSRVADFFGIGSETRTVSSASAYPAATMSQKLNFLEKQNESMSHTLDELANAVSAVFQSASDGKKKIYDAITGVSNYRNSGAQLSANASFADMAAVISQMDFLYDVEYSAPPAITAEYLENNHRSIMVNINRTYSEVMPATPYVYNVYYAEDATTEKDSTGKPYDISQYRKAGSLKESDAFHVFKITGLDPARRYWVCVTSVNMSGVEETHLDNQVLVSNTSDYTASAAASNFSHQFVEGSSVKVDWKYPASYLTGLKGFRVFLNKGALLSAGSVVSETAYIYKSQGTEDGANWNYSYTFKNLEPGADYTAWFKAEYAEDSKGSVLGINQNQSAMYSFVSCPMGSFADLSWKDIQVVCRAGMASRMWSVGDEHGDFILIGINEDRPCDAAGNLLHKGTDYQEVITIQEKNASKTTSYPKNEDSDVCISEAVKQVRPYAGYVKKVFCDISGVNYREVQKICFWPAASELFGTHPIISSGGTTYVTYTFTDEGAPYSYYRTLEVNEEGVFMPTEKRWFITRSMQNGDNAMLCPNLGGISYIYDGMDVPIRSCMCIY